MIGYSDSSKDAGKLSASWHQYKLQEEVLIIAKNIKLITFFHGKGGSWKRWWTNSSNDEISTSNSVYGRIRITDQGEMIQQKYGYEPLAKYNLCSYIGSVMQATLNPPHILKILEKINRRNDKNSTLAYRKYK